jgi:hypothetical protein
VLGIITETAPPRGGRLRPARLGRKDRGQARGVGPDSRNRTALRERKTKTDSKEFRCTVNSQTFHIPRWAQEAPRWTSTSRGGRRALSVVVYFQRRLLHRGDKSEENASFTCFPC